MNIKQAFLVAVLTVVLDYIFHLTFTIPMEVPAYFAAKFLIALPVAYFLLGKMSVGKVALIFTVLYSVFYYGIGVYLLQIPGLSVYTSSGYITIFGITNLVQVGLIEFFVHLVLFYVAAKFVLLTGGNRR